MGSLAIEIQDVSHGSSYGSQNVCWRMINYFSIKSKRIGVIIISGSLGIAAIVLYSYLMSQRKNDYSLRGEDSSL
jgi:hypothetical protein